jgi:hypothetical protein
MHMSPLRAQQGEPKKKALASASAFFFGSSLWHEKEELLLQFFASYCVSNYSRATAGALFV